MSFFSRTPFRKRYSDEVLLKGLQSMPSRWQSKIYNQFKEDLKSYCKYKFKFEEALFEAAYNDTLMAFYTKVAEGQFVKKSKLTTYLISVFHNKYIDQTRHFNSKVSNNSDAIDPVLNLSDTSRNILQQYLFKERLEKLRELLKQVGKNCLEVIELHAMGFQYKEIAEQLGLKNANTAKSRRRNCMVKVYQLIDDKNMFYGF